MYTVYDRSDTGNFQGTGFSQDAEYSFSSEYDRPGNCGLSVYTDVTSSIVAMYMKRSKFGAADICLAQRGLGLRKCGSGRYNTYDSGGERDSATEIIISNHVY